MYGMGITEYGLTVKDEDWTHNKKWVSELIGWFDDKNNDNNNNKNKLCYQTNKSPTYVLQYSQFKTGIGVVWSNNQSQLSLYLLVCTISQHTML